MLDEKTNILNLLPEELDITPAYRREQVFSWLHRHTVKDFSEMLNIPKALREELAAVYTINTPKEVLRQVSKDGTEKILWRLSGGELLETALMRYKHGTSACLSTQVGCRQGCAFCASGHSGFIRNLTAGEILGQFYCIKGETPGRVVLMGTGEPLDNFDEVIKFLKLISHPKGRGLSLRKISLSTSGHVPGILKLAELKLPVTLSISLHAPDDETRNLIMPINHKYPIAELLSAAEKYFSKTGRRISYEYVIIKGLNDTKAHATKLLNLLGGKPAHINLIPYNPIEGKPFAPPSREEIAKFANHLSGLDVTTRRTLGGDIDSACGQLRSGAIKQC